MRISDWSSDVCSSDLQQAGMVDVGGNGLKNRRAHRSRETVSAPKGNHGIQPLSFYSGIQIKGTSALIGGQVAAVAGCDQVIFGKQSFNSRSEEHTSELQSLMRISYAVFCLKKKK